MPYNKIQAGRAYDSVGCRVEEGDFITYATRSGSVMEIKVARVEEILEKKLRVVAMNKHPWQDRFYRTQVSMDYVTRVDPDTMDEDLYFELLTALDPECIPD